MLSVMKDIHQNILWSRFLFNLSARDTLRPNDYFYRKNKKNKNLNNVGCFDYFFGVSKCVAVQRRQNFFETCWINKIKNQSNVHLLSCVTWFSNKKTNLHICLKFFHCQINVQFCLFVTETRHMAKRCTLH